MQTVDVTQASSRPVEDLYAFLSHHENLSKVFGVPVARLRDGEDSPNGVGSVRRVGPAPIGAEETVTAAVDNELIEYKITRNGGPIRHHAGRLEFRSTPGGSEVRWVIRFDSPLPLAGPVLARVLGSAVRRGLRRLA